MRFANCPGMSRRAFLAASAAVAMPAYSNPSAPASRVSVARCADYGKNLEPVMATMFDQLGGLGSLVAGKTVAVKINMTGSPRDRVGAVPAEDAQYTHPAVIVATVNQLFKAGAKKVRVIEGAFATSDPLPEFMLDAGWDPNWFYNAGPRVEIENTNVAGAPKKYFRVTVPGKPHLYPAFDLNHSYVDCDVMVSIAKLKEHATCGVTMTMKNMFGITPITIYGDNAGKDEPALDARGGRGPFHSGHRQPSASSPGQIDPNFPRNPFLRVPRVVADICAARPVNLAIIDGVYSMSGGEGPWVGSARANHPGLLVAGLNPVCTDAVGAALMGFDPMNVRGKAPFEVCDNHLQLAEENGVGTRDLSKIEVVGVPVKDAVYPFRSKDRQGFPR